MLKQLRNRSRDIDRCGRMIGLDMMTPESIEKIRQQMDEDQVLIDEHRKTLRAWAIYIGSFIRRNGNKSRRSFLKNSTGHSFRGFGRYSGGCLSKTSGAGPEGWAAPLGVSTQPQPNSARSFASSLSGTGQVENTASPRRLKVTNGSK